MGLSRIINGAPLRSPVRQELPLKRASLTGLEVNITRNARHKQLSKVWNDKDIMGTWKKSSYAATLDKRAKRAATTDFDRFKVMVARKQKAIKVNTEFKKLKKASLKK